MKYSVITKKIAQAKEFCKQCYIGYKIQKLKTQADKLHIKHNDQQFVLMFKGKLTIMSRQYFKYQRQHGQYPLSFTVADLKKISYYYTPR